MEYFEIEEWLEKRWERATVEKRWERYALIFLFIILRFARNWEAFSK